MIQKKIVLEGSPFENHGLSQAILKYLHVLEVFKIARTCKTFHTLSHDTKSFNKSGVKCLYYPSCRSVKLCFGLGRNWNIDEIPETRHVQVLINVEQLYYQAYSTRNLPPLSAEMAPTFIALYSPPLARDLPILLKILPHSETLDIGPIAQPDFSNSSFPHLTWLGSSVSNPDIRKFGLMPKNKSIVD